MDFNEAAERGKETMRPKAYVICFCLIAFACFAGTASAEFGTPVVNGVIVPAEWSGARTYNILVNYYPGSGAPPAPGHLYIMNDSTNLYFGLEFDITNFSGFTSSQISVELTHNTVVAPPPYEKQGTRTVGDDIFAVDTLDGPSGSVVKDWYLASAIDEPYWAVAVDALSGCANNGFYAYSIDYPNHKMTFELAKPLNSGDPPLCDINLSAGDSIYIRSFINAMKSTAPSDIGSTPVGFGTADMVTTLAGTAGSRGEVDGTGSAARFNGPQGITSDGTNFYVTDHYAHTIRKIVIATGAVTTLAGLADNPGSTDATGSLARFNNPVGITTDGTNLYVADSGNHTIRKILISTGAVTTLAGAAGVSGTADGPLSGARFNIPRGITTDGTLLYVTDTFNHTIRIIGDNVSTPAGAAGVIGTTDGPGSVARFNIPHSITTDGTNLYVTDSDNFTIRKIVKTFPYAVTTLAGAAGVLGTTDGIGLAARFNRVRGINTDGTDLYVADAYNHTIRKIVIGTGAVTTVAGLASVLGSADGNGSAARFNFPWGVITDGTNLYVTDSENFTIRKIYGQPGPPLINYTVSAPPLDTDGDGVPDSIDNCPNVYNPIVSSWSDMMGEIHLNSQPDYNLNGIGDACDTDLSPPTGLHVVSSSGSKVTLAWDAVTDPNLQSYEIRQRTCSECLPTLINAGDVNTATINLPVPGRTYNCQVRYLDKIGGISPYSTPSVPYTLSCSSADTDGDGIPDLTSDCESRIDNCPTVYNPGQSDLDGDGVGDVCDNCPKVYNPGQEPSTSNNALGAACDTGLIKKAVTVCTSPNPDGSCPPSLPPPTFTTGAPQWVSPKLTNGSEASLQTIRPDSHGNLILVGLKDQHGSGQLWLPVSNTRFAYGIPKDLYTIAANDCVTVAYNIARDYPDLAPGDYCGYFVYANMIQDPDLIRNTGYCDTNPGNCYPGIFAGAIVQADDTCFTVAGTALTQLPATVVFSPSNWEAVWGTSGIGPPVTATVQISGLTLQSTDFDTASLNTIRLNGTVPIIGGSASVASGILTVRFDGANAVRSLGPGNPGVSFSPVVDGRFKSTSSLANSYFSGAGAVTLPSHVGDGTLVLQADKHTVGPGPKPEVKKEPINGMTVRAFNTACTSKYYSNTWQNYPLMWDDTRCPAVESDLTNSTGKVSLSLPPGNYIAFGYYPDGQESKYIYPGVSVGSISTGEVKNKYLQVIQTSVGKSLPGKTTKLTGSELLVIEPENVEWSGTVELYPFVFQSVGDWAVSTAVAPPAGFVADYKELSTVVNNQIQALQFTEKDVGSDWVSTKVKHSIKHNGKTTTLDSKIGIKLSKELAKKKGISEFGEEYPYGKKVVK
jgi:hypothetical protein